MIPVFLFPTMTEMNALSKSPKAAHIYSDEKHSFLYLCSGPGRETAFLMKKLFSSREPYFFVTIGYAGALDSSYQRGDLVICHRFLAEGQSPLQSDFDWLEEGKAFLQKQGLNISLGTSYTSEKIVSNLSQKDNLSGQGAHVVEMENYWAAQMAQEMGKPFLSLRLVFDTYQTHLPDFGRLVKKNGVPSIPQTILHLSTRPHHLLPLLKIFSWTKKIAPHLSYSCIEWANFLKSRSLNA